MILALDCGTNQLNWALADARRWVAHGTVRNQDIGTLALRDWQNLPRPMRVVGVNVAGEAARVRVEAQLIRWRVAPEWLIAKEEAAGVRNGYALPSQLGGDRWAGLVAARRHLDAELFPAPCVVVIARTVVSVDAMDIDGAFRGGVVVPGINLMLQSIAASTTIFRIPPGRYHELPINNADAPYSGAVQSLCGLIERMRARLSAGATVPKCFLSGGAAAEIAAQLNARAEVVDNLVLEGVFSLADES
jgi:type III pantothenate kinase